MKFQSSIMYESLSEFESDVGIGQERVSILLFYIVFSVDKLLETL